MAILWQNGLKFSANNGHWDTTHALHKYLSSQLIFFTLQVFTGCNVENVAHLASHFTFFKLQTKLFQESPHANREV